MGDMETEVATFYRHAGLLLERGGHQPMHKTFNSTFVLCMRCTGIKMEQRPSFIVNLIYIILLSALMLAKILRMSLEGTAVTLPSNLTAAYLFEC